MSAVALLERLSSSGVRVELIADRLKIHAPRPLDPNILEAIRCHKSELLQLLALEAISQSSTRSERLCESPCECWPRELYNPQAARVFVERDQTLLPDQRATLLQYAARAVA